MSVLADAFLNNRAEQLPNDVTNQFIVPPFFRRISIFGDKKSVRILGGRGCGKTFFIRYFCHATTFSARRRSISDDALNGVGLYFRPDTGFCSLMTSEWIGEEESRLAFSHYVCLQLLGELSDAIKNIANADLASGPLRLAEITLPPALRAFFNDDVKSLSHLEDFVELGMTQLELWVRNPRRHTAPTLLSFATLLPRIADVVAATSGRLSGFSLRIFVDEFENLKQAQRSIICDAIKHPTERLAVHIAHKRDAVSDFKTSSDERVVLVHDLRSIDLEEELCNDSQEFDLLAAELFLMRLSLQGFSFQCEVFDPAKLHDPDRLSERMEDSYRKKVLETVRSILPSLNAPEVASSVMTDDALFRRLVEMVDKGLAAAKISNRYKAADLLDKTKPEASIVLGALLNRQTRSAETIIDAYLKASRKSKDDLFYKTGGWIDNNLYGCLFYLYAGLPRRPNLLYAGFDRFCQLASPNLRFFQELCHVTLLLAYERKDVTEVGTTLIVDPDLQARAVRQVSDDLFQEISQLGLHGERLLEVVRRLGQLFEAFNRRRSQSEPEINHFSVDEADRSELSDHARQILREAKVWSVLYEEKETKSKSDYDVAQADWVLNRIYCPHFSISYRKRRKVTLKAGQVNVVLCGTSEHFETLLKTVVDPRDRDADVGTTAQLF